MGVVLVLLYLVVLAEATYSVAQSETCGDLDLEVIKTEADCRAAFDYFHPKRRRFLNHSGQSSQFAFDMDETNLAKENVLCVTSTPADDYACPKFVSKKQGDSTKPPGCYYKIILEEGRADELIFNDVLTGSAYSTTALGLCTKPSSTAETVATECETGTDQNNQEDCICKELTCTATKGLYCEAAGASSSCKCSPGTYVNEDKECIPCLAGFASSNLHSLGCTSCSAGESAQSAATECTACARGKFNDQTEQPSCKDCISGTFNNVDGAASCNDCPAGRSQSFSAAYDCVTCERGQFNDQTKQSTCKDCPVGKKLTSSQGMITKHDQESDCVDCPGGKYNDNLGWYEECPSCTNGDQTETGRVTCDGVNEDGTVTCSSGKFKQSDLCVDCSVGKYNDVQDGACKDCELGLYNDEKRQTEW